MLTEKDQQIIAQVAVKAAVEMGCASGNFDRLEADAERVFGLILDLCDTQIGAAPVHVPPPEPLQQQQRTVARRSHAGGAASEFERAKQAVVAAFPGTREVEQDPIDAAWQDVFEHPDDWWDNRRDKRNPKAPDFKAKRSNDRFPDVALWITDKKTPDWVHNRLKGA